jgi:hypothetical protein
LAAQEGVAISQKPCPRLQLLWPPEFNRAGAKAAQQSSLGSVIVLEAAFGVMTMQTFVGTFPTAAPRTVGAFTPWDGLSLAASLQSTRER